MKKAAILLAVSLIFSGPILAAAPPALLKISLPFEGSVAVAVLDARPDVISGDRKDTFVGFSRSLYGIPFPAYTKSKKPLAQDLSDLVIRGLKLGGKPAKFINTSPNDHRQGAIQVLQKSGAERLILIEIRDWWTDTLIHTDLHYDLSLTILSSEGQELGSSSIGGHDELGRKQRPERKDLSVAVNDIFATLFGADAVQAAFAANAQPSTKKNSCTVEQILKMKESGLTQDQIEAACGTSH